MRILLILALRVIPLLTLALQPVWLGAAPYDPLFASTDELQLTLQGPFALIDRERNKARVYPGTLNYVDPSGEQVVLEVEFQVRGNSRLRKDVCRHTPLWLQIKTRPEQDTLFENQDRIKLVVQCQSQQRYAGYLVREHQAYRMFGQLTERSYATRLAQLTFHDPAHPRADRSDPGILIEHHARLGQRLGLREVEVDKVQVEQLEPTQASLVSLFMYMIANTDYSMLVGEDQEDCCHNIRLFEDAQGRYVPIPYDFDFSGFVDASYAAPPAELSLSSVRQRLYRGFCVHNDPSVATLPHFEQERAAIMAILADTTHVSPEQASRAQHFIEEFYRLIADADAVNSNMLQRCR